MPEELRHQFVLELFKSGRAMTHVGRLVVDFDTAPLLEWARVWALRQAPALAPDLMHATGVIEPVWDSALGEPYVEGLRTTLALAGRPAVACVTPITFFADHARQAAAQLLCEGKLAGHESVQFIVTAFPLSADPDAGEGAIRFSVEPVVRPLPLTSGRLESFAETAVPYGQIDERDLPAFIPQSVIDEAVSLTREAGAVETGGILMGRLCRDVDQPELFVEITGQFPLRHALHESKALTFTPDTWTDAAMAMEQRNAGETCLGFWHSHPACHWCDECPEEKRRTCRLSGAFFSDQDACLFRAVFPRAYSLALVISDSNHDGLTWPLFGWREGRVVNRGFYISDASQATSPSGGAKGES